MAVDVVDLTALVLPEVVDCVEALLTMGREVDVRGADAGVTDGDDRGRVAGVQAPAVA